jgi:hypothetical protein
MGLVGSYVLILYGNPVYKKENTIYGIFFLFIASIQFMDFLFWIDLSNALGINYITSLIGPLLNVGQPLILYLVKLLISKDSSPYGNTVAVFNGFYLLYIIKMYSTFISSGDILTTVKHGHLSWSWIKYSNPLFYLLLTAINILYLSNFTYSGLLLTIIYACLYLSYKYFRYNVGELWCFFGAFIPLFMFGASYYI